MIDRSAPPQSQRIGVLTSVVALHMALLVAFFATSGAASPPAVKSGVMSLVSIKADVPAQRPPPPPILPSKLVDEIRKLTADALSMDPDSAAVAATSGQCATLDILRKALVADHLAVAAVIQAPPETRSIAEAIVMWNAGWSSAASAPESPLGPARTVVEQSLVSVEDGCLDEPIVGPRLVPIGVPNSQSTMFLVFGSGHWTWRELVAGQAAAQQAASDMERARPWYEIDWF